MATMARQPFAPIDAARLQTITSLKNRQNATSLTPSIKRKAVESVEEYDSENIDPLQSVKRAKGQDSKFGNDFFKPSKFVFTKALATPTLPTVNAALPSPMRAPARPRHILTAKSPAARMSSGVSKAPLFTAPNRSPTRSNKRLGLLSSRRRAMGSSFTRIDPPSMHSSPAPFSLDEAIKGTVPGYMSRQPKHASRSSLSNLLEPEINSSWVFDIHEDTPEQEMTNLLQHSTCVLDISSDEESEQKLRAGRVEDKENIPPADDVSQTSVRRAAASRVADGGMEYEKPRNALGSLNVEDFYTPGCDGSTVVLVPADEESEVVVAGDEPQAVVAGEEPEAIVALEASLPLDTVPSPAVPVVEATVPELVQASTIDVHEDVAVDIVDAIIKGEQPGQEAAVLQPIDGTGDNFDMWESGSAHDENEVPRARSTTPTPVLAELGPLDVPTMEG